MVCAARMQAWSNNKATKLRKTTQPDLAASLRFGGPVNLFFPSDPLAPDSLFCWSLPAFSPLLPKVLAAAPSFFLFSASSSFILSHSFLLRPLLSLRKSIEPADVLSLPCMPVRTCACVCVCVYVCVCVRILGYVCVRP